MKTSSISINVFKKIVCPVCKEYLFKLDERQLSCKCDLIKLNASTTNQLLMSIKNMGYFIFVPSYNEHSNFRLLIQGCYHSEWYRILKEEYNIITYFNFNSLEELIEKIQWFVNSIYRIEINSIFK